MRNTAILLFLGSVVACGGAIQTESTYDDEGPSTPTPPSPRAQAPVEADPVFGKPPTISAADGDTCSSMKSLKPSGKLEVLVGEPPRLDRPEPYIDVVATEIKDGKQPELAISLTTLPGECSWRKSGIRPSYESHLSFQISTPGAAGPGTYEKEQVFWAAGGSFMDCPGSGGGGGSATASSRAKVTITTRTASSVSGTVERYDDEGKLVFKANFDAPFCSSDGAPPPPPRVRCCAI